MSKRERACDDQDDCSEVGPFDPGKVYSEQLNFREILITGDVTDALIEKAVIPIRNFNRYDDEMESKVNPYAKEPYVREPVTILINTSGGVLTACMSLVSAIKASKTPIRTVALGKVYSAGFLILIAGHERISQEYSDMMMHPGSGGYIGTIPSILKHADYVADLQDRIIRYVAENTFIEVEELQEMCEREYDWYMQPEEALCRGVIDVIIIGNKTITLDDYIEAQKAIEKKSANKTKKKLKENK